jgi:hypothetical protein
MPKLIACVAGLVALVAGIFGNVEPTTCLTRAFISLIIGWCFGAFWQAMGGNPVQLTVVQSGQNDTPKPKEREDADAA